MDRIVYDLINIGGGVTGTASAFMATDYSNLSSVALIEKESEIAVLNSNHLMNSGTLHFGDIETNYGLEKARSIKRAADLVARYMTDRVTGDIFKRTHKMVLGVGTEEVVLLEKRHDEMKVLFPKLRKLNREEIALYEPNVMKDRDPNEPVLALFNEYGFAVDYQALAKAFVEDAAKSGKRFDLFLGKKVVGLEKEADTYKVTLDDKTILYGKTVIVAAGGLSLVFAKKMGLGKEYGILPVAGNFYTAKNLIKGKVYRVQIKGIPFAAIHGDADVIDQNETRFGPTTQVLPLLERPHYSSFFDFLRASVFSLGSLFSLLKVLSNRTLLRFVIQNLIFGLAFFGKTSFTKKVKQIIPSITEDQLTFGKGLGGIRPQVINTKTGKLEMGEVKIIGDNIIFDITPSPGASICLKNAEGNIRKIVEMLGDGYCFDEEKFQKNFPLE